MENFAQSLRESTIIFLKGGTISPEYQIYVDRFVNYTDAYCAEMKTTMSDILYDDKTFDLVFGLFNSVILIKQMDLVLV